MPGRVLLHREERDGEEDGVREARDLGRRRGVEVAPVDLEHGHLVDHVLHHPVHEVWPVVEGERHKLVGGIERAPMSTAAASAQGRGCCPARARQAFLCARRSTARPSTCTSFPSEATIAFGPPEHFRIRIRCASRFFMCSFMFTRRMEMSPPRQPARQSRMSYQSFKNMYVPEVWLEMSHNDAGSCERP